jgi:tetratricopeptide (TPR) repeat protein
VIDRSDPDETNPTVANRSDRGVASGRDVTRSQIITGDHNVIQIQPPADPVATALHQLRAPVGDFVGREQEIDTLIHALRRGSRASITGISGMGGIGKTELALLVAEHLRDDYPDAQFFINLQGTDANPRLPQEVLAVCIRAFLGAEASLPEDLDQLSQFYRSQLSGKRVLLLLDNAADGAQVRPLLPPTGSALLVTSRQAIALPGMTPHTLNLLTDKEARELLLEIAPRAGPVAREICALCDYLPLAIRAAGSLLATTADLDPFNYAVLLKDERKRLAHIGTEGVEIGVAASFNLSYARLPPNSARVFRLLSVFPATFDAPTEEVVCADAGHVQLSELVRRSLVLYDSTTKRYRLHDLGRLFADTKLSTEERSLAQKRFAMHYKDVLTAANELYKKGGEALLRGLALFDLEWGNIQAGHTWVAAQIDAADVDEAELGIAYPQAGADLLDLRQHSRERIRWLEIGSAAARRLRDRKGEGAALGNLGIAYANLGETRRAIQFFEQRLTIARELGDRKGEGIALGNLGVAYRKLGETHRAIQFYEQRLTIARELGDRRGEGIVLGNLGNAYDNLGETRRAIQLYEQHLSITRELGDRRGEGNALGNLGVAYKKLGEIKRAMQIYEQALLIVREIGDRRGEGIDLWNMSLALDQLGERAQAIQQAEQSLVLYEQIEDPNAAKVRAKLVVWREEIARNKATENA